MTDTQEMEELAAHIRKTNKMVLDQADCSGSHGAWPYSKIIFYIDELSSISPTSLEHTNVFS